LAKEATFAATVTAGSQTIWPDEVVTMDGGEEVDWKQIRVRGGDRELYQLVEGKHITEYSIDGIVQTGRWIAMALGKDVVTGASPFTHTITHKPGMPFPSWVLEGKYVDTSSLSVYVKGLTVDSLRLSGGEEDLLRFSGSIKAHSSVKNVGADSTVTTLTTEPFKFHQGRFTYFGSTISRVRDFEAVINNQGNMLWPYDDSANVKQFPKEYIPGGVAYELRTTVVPIDSTFFDTLKNAASNLACTILFTRGASDTLSIQFTNCVVKRADHPVPEEGPVNVSLEIIPRNLTVVLVNSDSGSYGDAS